MGVGFSRAAAAADSSAKFRGASLVGSWFGSFLGKRDAALALAAAATLFRSSPCQAYMSCCCSWSSTN